MSRIGNKPITVPENVEVKLEGNKIVFEKLDEGKDEKVKMTWDVVNNKVVCKKAN